MAAGGSRQVCRWSVGGLREVIGQFFAVLYVSVLSRVMTWINQKWVDGEMSRAHQNFNCPRRRSDTGHMSER